MAYSVLVVDRHPVALARWSAALRDVGYEVTATTSFAAARQRIANRPPNLLIASSRLGSYHGLHLVDFHKDKGENGYYLAAKRM